MTSEKEKSPLIKATGLWETKDKNGNQIFSGSFGGARVLIMKNTFKDKDTQPDFQLYFTQNQKKREAEAFANEETADAPAEVEVPF